MTPENARAEHQLLETASVIEGFFFVVNQLGETNMPDLAAMYLGAARDMVSNREFADMAVAEIGEAVHEDTARTLGRRALAFGVMMRVIEGAVDVRNPGVKPPLSEQMRAQARERYGDRIDEQLAGIPAFPFGE